MELLLYVLARPGTSAPSCPPAPSKALLEVGAGWAPGCSVCQEGRLAAGFNPICMATSPLADCPALPMFHTAVLGDQVPSPWMLGAQRCPPQPHPDAATWGRRCAVPCMGTASGVPPASPAAGFILHRCRRTKTSGEGATERKFSSIQRESCECQLNSVSV